MHDVTSLSFTEVSHGCADHLPLLKVFWLIELWKRGWKHEGSFYANLRNWYFLCYKSAHTQCRAVTRFSVNAQTFHMPESKHHFYRNNNLNHWELWLRRDIPFCRGALHPRSQPAFQPLVSRRIQQVWFERQSHWEWVGRDAGQTRPLKTLAQKRRRAPSPSARKTNTVTQHRAWTGAHLLS